MSAFNRFVVALFAIVWLAALGLALWLVWDQSREIDFSRGGIDLAFDIVASSRAEQILGSIIIGALAIPPLALLMMQLVPARRRPVEDRNLNERYTRLEHEVESLKRQLNQERAPRPVESHPVEPRPEPAEHRRGWRFLRSGRH